MTVHTCSPNSWTVLMGELPQVPDKSGLQSELHTAQSHLQRKPLSEYKYNK